MITKTDRELATSIIATCVGADLMCTRKVERVVDEDDGNETSYLVGELETWNGLKGSFSIPEHWPEGTTIEWTDSLQEHHMKRADQAERALNQAFLSLVAAVAKLAKRAQATEDERTEITDLFVEIGFDDDEALDRITYD